MIKKRKKIIGENTQSLSLRCTSNMDLLGQLWRREGGGRMVVICKTSAQVRIPIHPLNKYSFLLAQRIVSSVWIRPYTCLILHDPIGVTLLTKLIGQALLNLLSKVKPNGYLNINMNWKLFLVLNTKPNTYSCNIQLKLLINTHKKKQITNRQALCSI